MRSEAASKAGKLSSHFLSVCRSWDGKGRQRRRERERGKGKKAPRNERRGNEQEEEEDDGFKKIDQDKKLDPSFSNNLQVVELLQDQKRSKEDMRNKNQDAWPNISQF